MADVGPGRRRLGLRGRAGRAPGRPPPALRARGGHVALGRRAAARRPLPAPPRARRARGARPRRAHGEVDAAIVAYPHGACAPVVRAAARARRRRSSTCSADFRLRDLDVYEEYYVQHPHPELIAEAVYGLPELYRDATRATRRWSPARAATRPATILALAPLADAGLIADVVVDAKSGVSGAGRAATSKTHFVTVDENVTPYGVGTHRHAPEIDQELAALGAARGDHVHAAPAAARPGRAGVLLRDASTASPATSRALYEQTYADEPFVELAARPPGVRDVRETNVCRIHVVADERTRQGLRVRRDRQPVEGHVVAGRPVAEPDVRPRRDGGPAVSCCRAAAFRRSALRHRLRPSRGWPAVSFFS